MQKSYSWNPSTRIYENGKYIKNVADDSKIMCDRILMLWISYQQMWQILCQKMSRVSVSGCWFWWYSHVKISWSKNYF